MNNNNNSALLRWLGPRDITEITQAYVATGRDILPNGTFNTNYQNDPVYQGLIYERAVRNGMPVHLGMTTPTQPVAPPFIHGRPAPAPPAPAPVIDTPPRLQEVGDVIYYTEDANGNKQFEIDSHVHSGVDTSKVMVDHGDNKQFVTSNDGKRRHYLKIKTVQVDVTQPDDGNKKNDVKPSPKKKTKTNPKKKIKRDKNTLPKLSLLDLQVSNPFSDKDLDKTQAETLEPTTIKTYKTYIRNLHDTLEHVGATKDDKGNIVKKGSNEAKGSPCYYVYLGVRKFRTQKLTIEEFTTHLVSLVNGSRLTEHGLYFAVFSLVTQVKVMPMDMSGKPDGDTTYHLNELDIKYVLKDLNHRIDGKRHGEIRRAIGMVEGQVKNRWEPFDEVVKK